MKILGHGGCQVETAVECSPDPQTPWDEGITKALLLKNIDVLLRHYWGIIKALLWHYEVIIKVSNVSKVSKDLLLNPLLTTKNDFQMKIHEILVQSSVCL